MVLREGGDPRNPAHYRLQDVNTGSCVGATVAAGCIPGSTADKSNANEQMSMRTPLERESLYVDGIYYITDDIRFRTNLLYSQRWSQRTIAGFPMQATSPSRGGPAALAANSHFNPTTAPISNWWRRTWEVPRVTDSTLTTYRFSGALEGSFEWADRFFDWDVSYLNNSNRVLHATYGNLNIANTRAAVGPSFLNARGQVQCGTAAAPIAFTDCVPFNPFLPAGREGPGGLTNNRALQDFLFQREHATGETETTVMMANLTGSIMTLPAGDLAFAVGIENRKEEGAFVPDALSVTGGSTNLAAGPTRGSYSVDEIYLEFQVPLLSGLPFAHALDLSLASRSSEYDTFGDTTNSKFGLEWNPIESVLVRGTWSEGFRAPTIADLFGGGSQTFSFFQDPCDTVFGLSRENPAVRANCVAAMGPLANTFRQLGAGMIPVGAPNAQTPVPFTSGSNPTLQPETAVSKTLGVVWSPDFVEGLNLSLDWWNIRIEETIVADAPTTILNDCFVQDIARRCSPLLFTRDPTLGFVNFMSFGSRNAGFREVEGFDFTAAYQLATANWGSFSVVSNSTYTSSDVLVSTDDPRHPISSVGRAGPAGIDFRLRSNLNLGWQKGDFSVNWIVRHYSSVKEACAYFVPGSTEPNLECNEITFAPTGALLPDGSPASALSRRNRTGSNSFNDVRVGWEAPWNATIAVGANNVFERIGPVMYSNPAANFPYYGGFDIGRFTYMSYTQRF